MSMAHSSLRPTASLNGQADLRRDEPSVNRSGGLDEGKTQRKIPPLARLQNVEFPALFKRGARNPPVRHGLYAEHVGGRLLVAPHLQKRQGFRSNKDSQDLAADSAYRPQRHL